MLQIVTIRAQTGATMKTFARFESQRFPRLGHIRNVI